MKYVQKNIILLMLLTLIIGLTTFAQHAKHMTTSTKEVKIKAEEQNKRSTKNENNNIPTCNFRVGKSDSVYNPNLYLTLLNFDGKLRADQQKKAQTKLERAKEVMQGNNYLTTGNERGQFLDNSILLDGKPLDYGDFDLLSKGKLTIQNTSSGEPKPVAFYLYLRSNNSKVEIPGYEHCNRRNLEVEISEILQHALPGDELVIEAVNKEEHTFNRVLKLLGGGC